LAALGKQRHEEHIMSAATDVPRDDSQRPTVDETRPQTSLDLPEERTVIPASRSIVEKPQTISQRSDEVQQECYEHRELPCNAEKSRMPEPLPSYERSS
jgi:hypothetical protein